MTRQKLDDDAVESRLNPVTHIDEVGEYLRLDVTPDKLRRVAADVDMALTLTPDANESREAKTVGMMTLDFAESCRFLGIPQNDCAVITPNNDRQIHKRFKQLFALWGDEGDGRVDDYFWKNIRIKVWHKENIERIDRENNCIVGKATRKIPSLPESGKPLEGNVMDGRAITTFLSRAKNAEAHRYHVVQLLGMTLTEEMLEYAQNQLGYRLSKEAA